MGQDKWINCRYCEYIINIQSFFSIEIGEVATFNFCRIGVE